jgi:hypothetical protein
MFCHCTSSCSPLISSCSSSSATFLISPMIHPLTPRRLVAAMVIVSFLGEFHAVLIALSESKFLHSYTQISRFALSGEVFARNVSHPLMHAFHLFFSSLSQTLQTSHAVWKTFADLQQELSELEDFFRCSNAQRPGDRRFAVCRASNRSDQVMGRLQSSCGSWHVRCSCRG